MENDLQQYKVYTFRDFITPNYHATIPILGKRGALDALNRTLSAGYHAQSMNLDNEYPAYGPLVVALNTICAERNMPLITASELHALQSLPGFAPFAKNFIKTNQAQHLCNLENFLDSQGSFTEDDMALMTAAFAASSGYGNIGLGFVTVVNGQSVKAFHYPDSNQPLDYTAWIVADFRAKDVVFYGVGKEAVQQHSPIVAREEGRGDSMEGAGEDAMEDDADNENNQVPSITPRKTATRVLLQQVPLPANLTAEDILHHHKSRLQYNNVLKVALVFSNKEIADECKSDLLPKDQRLCHASAVVKRINTAINWIEDQFEIDNNAFRTTFDQERRTKGIPARGKDEVSDDVLTANSSKVDAAMAWIRAGGPRPNHNFAPTLHDPIANIPSVTNPVSANPFSGSHVPQMRPSGTIPTGYVPAYTMPAGTQGTLVAPVLGYGHQSQMDIASAGDNGSGTMGLDGGSHFTSDYDMDGKFSMDSNGEMGMEGDFDWNPREFSFDDPFSKYD